MSTRAIFLLLMFLAVHATAQIDPYPPITAVKTGIKNPFSPDPIFGYSWADPKISDGLECYTLQPRNVVVFDPRAINIKGFKQGKPIVINGEGYIRFDFGQTNAGWLEFDSPDLSGTVEMTISEYDQPPTYAASYPTKTMVPKKYGNTYRLELNPELYEGVRYGWIQIRSFSKTWHITKVRLVCQVRPTNYQGSFACSDTMLTRIWYTGAYTVKLNLLKDYLGAILMNRGDRFSWTGDAHPAQAASMVAFGNYDFVKMNLAHTSTQSNGIRSYALYWVLSLVDYYRYTGDASVLRDYIANTTDKLDDAYRVYGTKPNLLFYGWDERLGAGFEHPDVDESQNAYKMLSIRAWQEFSEVMAALGEKHLQQKYQGYAREKIQAERQGDKWYGDFGLHAGADAVNTGLLNQNERDALYKKSFTDKVNRISYSPFNQYFVIKAFAGMQKYDDALSSIRDLWGGQITYGGTTFFEDYRPSWNEVVGINGTVPANQCGFTSLCHPWGAGVTKWLSEEVLGIKPTSPGFTTFDILPHLGRTLTAVSGKTPTLHGVISADFNTKTGICNVTVPNGTTGRIGIPKVEKNIKHITINGKVVWDGKYHLLAGINGANESAEHILLNGVKPGHYKIRVVYSGTTPKYTEQPTRYAAKFLGIDNKTGGNWGGVYGKDGYVLCNYEGNGRDRAVLPSYVSSISYYKFGADKQPRNVVWQAGTDDKRALAPDKGNTFPRTAACLYAADGDQIGYTFTTTIALKEEHAYKVSLYVLDWDHNQRQIAVEMFDASTSDLIAPVKVVKDATGGAYLTFAYNRSAKFRINMVRGTNPVLSGLFFDED
ncbi:hypothetical protein IM792_18365 [Mucilaginibacter sp. JRF]|uniref:alpha-L-rhamnosidase C-terminal domain-containing protein n=1 Tax=Mucilaginibacter sp. JRF TaxID=2780088 RepID=UPI001882A106|nr:alpha-L-rhamnosidase C-terminal domain-containing protein [Mucilaginibacter sp. JRF]MBE9586423.1 hypothetical protein [Mucilaginibacter sp. JRF]